MKFKYVGQSPIKDIDLTLAGIFKPNESIHKGEVFEVPDDNKVLIQRVKLNGVYEEYIPPKRKYTKPKKQKKEDKLEEEE